MCIYNVPLSKSHEHTQLNVIKIKILPSSEF